MKKDLQNSVRIIGGKWRGRKLAFPNEAGLRPTADRIRETVFNWLAPYIVGRNCLDLFAGSGVFGFEAISRGAARAVLVDQSKSVVNALQKISNSLKCDSIVIKHASVPDQLKSMQIDAKFDMIFLDPPYQSDLLNTSFRMLEDEQWLDKGALVYVEQARDSVLPPTPKHWELLKKQESAGTCFMLFRAN